jgi:hypothetical protein
MKMTKQEALDRIEELKRFVEESERKPLTLKLDPPDGDNRMAGYINGEYAFMLYTTEQQGGSRIEKITGRRAIAFLGFNSGQFYLSNGTPISGYIYYKPKGE